MPDDVTTGFYNYVQATNLTFDGLDIVLHNLLTGFKCLRTLILIHGGCLECAGAIPNLVVGIGKAALGLQMLKHQRAMLFPDFDVKLHLRFVWERKHIVTHQC